MNGAREYAELFRNTQQHGKLYLSVGEHARGKTFHIYVLPSEEKVLGLRLDIPNAVEVYGIVSGNPGWTEGYGWLHRGPWEKDFEALVVVKREEVETQNLLIASQKAVRAANIAEREKQLLAGYKP